MTFEARAKSKRKAQVEWPGLFFGWEQAALALSAISHLFWGHRKHFDTVLIF